LGPTAPKNPLIIWSWFRLKIRQNQKELDIPTLGDFQLKRQIQKDFCSLINGSLAQNRYGLHANISGTLGDILKLARKNGKNTILDEVTPHGQARVRPMDKLE